MNGKAMVIGWTVAGCAIMFCMYMLYQFVANGLTP